LIQCQIRTEAEDLVGGGKSIYCKPIGNLSTPVIETFVNYWVITAITNIVIVAAAGGAIWKRKHLRGTFTIIGVLSIIKDFAYCIHLYPEYVFLVLL
jgi:hypothetical protein